MSRRRSPEREEWLSDVLVTALAHDGYGFPQEVSTFYEGGNLMSAVIIDRYIEEGDEEYGKQYAVNLDTMSRGLRILRENRSQSDWVKRLLLADRTNGQDGDVDVIGALAVLECALFGSVIYA